MLLNRAEYKRSMEDVAIALSSCRRLEHLSLECPGEGLREVNRLFSKDMPLLSSLDLTIKEDWGSGIGDVGEMLLKLSEHVGSLRTFTFRGPSQDKGDFEAFARIAPMIQTVYISFQDYDVSLSLDDSADFWHVPNCVILMSTSWTTCTGSRLRGLLIYAIDCVSREEIVCMWKFSGLCTLRDSPFLLRSILTIL